MWLQLILFLLAFVVCNLYESVGDTENTRHRYVVFLIFVLTLQSALRNYAVGPDTYSYFLEWDIHGNESWHSIWHRFHEVYVLGIGKDAGYPVLIKILYFVLRSFRLFLFAFAIAFFITLCKLAEKHLHTLRQMYMFFCLYQVMFYSFFSITGIRQGIATILALLSIQFVEKKKVPLFIIVILIASFIHKSVMLFLPFYLVYHTKKSKSVLITSLLALPVMFVFARQFAVFMIDFSGIEQYRGYAESEYEYVGASNFLVLIVVISLSCLVAKMNDSNSIPDFVVNSLGISLIFTPLMWVDPSMMRVIQYYSIFALIGMPLSIDNLVTSKSISVILYWSFWLVLVATTIRHNYEYAFFWQYMKLPSVYI